MWTRFFFCTKVVLARLSNIFLWPGCTFISLSLISKTFWSIWISIYFYCLTFPCVYYFIILFFILAIKIENYFLLIKWFIGLNIHCMHELYTFTLLLLVWFHKIGKLSCSPNTRAGSITWDMIYEDHVLSLMEACGLNMWPISMSPLFFMQSRRWRRSIQWRNIN